MGEGCFQFCGYVHFSQGSLLLESILRLFVKGHNICRQKFIKSPRQGHNHKVFTCSILTTKFGQEWQKRKYVCSFISISSLPHHANLHPCTKALYPWLPFHRRKMCQISDCIFVIYFFFFFFFFFWQLLIGKKFIASELPHVADRQALWYSIRFVAVKPNRK